MSGGRYSCGADRSEPQTTCPHNVRLCQVGCNVVTVLFSRVEGIAENFNNRFVRSTTLTKWIARNFLITMCLWITGPFIVHRENPGQSFDARVNVSRRYENIININFPVTAQTYNEHYFVFYIMEVSIGACIVYGSVLFDVFLMSFCWIVSAHYQSVTTAFEQFGHDSRSLKSKRHGESTRGATVMKTYRICIFVQ